MAYSAAKGYDPDKDYSDLLADPNLSPTMRTQYTGERENKIKDLYGGTEPGWNNTGSTFSELYGVNGLSGSTRRSSDSASGGSSGGGGSGGSSGSSSGSFSGGWDPSAYTAAATSGYISPEAQRIIDSMNSNSRAWFDTDTAGQKALHLENQDFARQLEDMGLTAVYDDAAGWTVTGTQKQPRAVSGGSSGGGSSGSFTYESAPAYADKYTDRIDALLEGILNREGFSYDLDSDPLWGTYQNQYRREGQRAMQNTYGQQAARTGGLGSSWAQSAAQQANNYYAAQAADKIPELYQLAYQMYLDDIEQEVQDLGLLEGASDTAYNRYRDTMSDWRNDKNFAYNQYRDEIGDARYADETAWNRGVYADETAYSREQDAYNRLLNEAGLISSVYGDNSRLSEFLDFEGNGSTDPFQRMQAEGITTAQQAVLWLARNGYSDTLAQTFGAQYPQWLAAQNAGQYGGFGDAKLDWLAGNSGYGAALASLGGYSGSGSSGGSSGSGGSGSSGNGGTRPAASAAASSGGASPALADAGAAENSAYWNSLDALALQNMGYGNLSAYGKTLYAQLMSGAMTGTSMQRVVDRAEQDGKISESERDFLSALI